MKKAEDFRKAFGEADSRFEAAVNDTLRELAAREEKPRTVSRRRFLVPVIAAAMVMILGIAIAASNGSFGLLDWLAENRSEETGYGTADETAAPFMGPVETEFATITVREARSDGYGVYLAVAFTPKEKDVLAFNWSVDPNTDGPETMGIEPDRPGQTLAEWAAGHGYRQLMRVSVISMGNRQAPPEDIRTNEEYAAWMDEQGISYRKTGTGGLMVDPLYSGPDFDSMVNDKSLLEEDGSTLVMAAGICLAGQDEYEVDWTACPAKMNKYGRIETGMAGMHSYENWSQGRLPIRIPAETDSGPEILAEYEGTISSLENPEERLPFTVQFIRTELNDYYRIRCTELARSFWGPTLVKDPEDPKTSGSEWAFAQSDIYSYAVQEVDGALVFTHGCRFPEALPDRIRVHWYNPEAYALSEDSVAERTDR